MGRRRRRRRRHAVGAEPGTRRARTPARASPCSTATGGAACRPKLRAVVLDHAHAVLARTQDLARVGRAPPGGTRRRRARRDDRRRGDDPLRRGPGRVSRRAARGRAASAGQPVGASCSRDLAAARLDVVVCVAPAVLPDGVTATPLLDEDLAVYAPVDGPPRAWGPWVTYPVGSRDADARPRRAAQAPAGPVTVVAESHQPEVLAQMVALGHRVVGAARAAGRAVRASHCGASATSRSCAARLLVARRADGPADPTVDALVGGDSVSPCRRPMTAFAGGVIVDRRRRCR